LDKYPKSVIDVFFITNIFTITRGLEGKSISPVTESTKYLFLFLCGGSSSTVSGERVIGNKKSRTRLPKLLLLVLLLARAGSCYGSQSTV
jgi:hypothetical protein